MMTDNLSPDALLKVLEAEANADALFEMLYGNDYARVDAQSVGMWLLPEEREADKSRWLKPKTSSAWETYAQDMDRLWARENGPIDEGPMEAATTKPQQEPLPKRARKKRVYSPAQETSGGVTSNIIKV